MNTQSIRTNVSRWLIVFVLLFPYPVFAQGEDPKTEADRLWQEAQTLIQSLELQAASEKLERAVILYREVDDQAGEVLCLSTLGDVKRRLSDYSGALVAYKDSLDISRAIGDRFNEARMLNNLGVVFYYIGQYDTALHHYEKALTIRQEVHDLKGEGTTLSNIGEVYRIMGQYDQALDSYSQALPIIEEMQDHLQEGKTRNNIGLTLNEMGEYHEAIQYYQQALNISRKIGNRAEEATTLNNFGLIYSEMGQNDQALKYFQDALAIQQEIGDRYKAETTLGNLGNLHFQDNDLELAEEYFSDQLAIDEELGLQGGKGAALNYLGLIYHERGQYQQALETYQEALEIRQDINDRRGEAFTLSNLGFAYENMGQSAPALEHYQQALDIQQEIGDRVGEANTLGKLGDLYMQVGDAPQAITHYQQAIERIESLQAEIKVEELKASFVNNNLNNYESVIGLLWNDSRYEEAFHYAERARARAFLDELANQNIDFRSGADATLLGREQTLRSEILAMRMQLVTLEQQPDAEEIREAMANITKSLSDRETEYTQLLTQMKLQHPEAASLVGVDVDSLTLTKIQELLDPQTTLVEYFVADDRILIFVITNNSFETTAVDVAYEQLFQAIESLYPFAGFDDPHPSGLQQLYTWLIGPIKDKLKTQVVGIVPHNVLHYIPFSALSDGDSYLIDDYTLFSLPSAGTLRFVQEKRQPTISNVLVFGNPTTDLPELDSAEEEATKIAGLYEAQPLLGDAATESVLAARASEADVLHLAAHGDYNTSNPLFSVIRLASDTQNDGRLEAHEVYGLDLTKATDLVVLSACQTSLGELKKDVVSKGDEIVGLNRAFLYAGTPTVIASLWNVNDASTGRLMEIFYSHLKSGMSKGEALRQAQIELQKEYPHPYDWAAFVLTGDPGQGSQGETVMVPGTGGKKPWPTVLAGAGLLALCCFGAALLITAGIAFGRYRKKVRS